MERGLIGVSNTVIFFAAALKLFKSAPVNSTESPAISASPTAPASPPVTQDPSVTVEPVTQGTKSLLESIVQNPLLLGAVVVVLLLLVVLVFFLLRKRKSVKPQAQETGVKPMNVVPAGSIHIGNIQNIGKRESQQDSFGISDLSNKALCQEKGLLAIVADGMGGLSNGAEVSALVTRTMLSQFSTRPATKDPSQELLNMLSNTNREVNTFLKSCKDRSGSTLVAVMVKDMMLHWLSVGDSRIGLVRKGALIQINREHTYASELDEKAAKGEIGWDKAKGDPQRNALTSYIGMGDLEKIDRSLRPLQLVPGDRILLMSDGVFGTLSDEEILSTMRLLPHEAAAELESLILSKNRKGQDNFTAIIIECF